MKRSLLSFLIAISFVGLSQTSSIKTAFVIPKKGTVDVNNVKEDYFINIQCVEKPVPGGFPQKKPDVNWNGGKNNNQIQSQASSTLSALFLGRNFAGNPWDNSTPNDNDLAISNNCKIVSVSNSIIYFHDCVVDSGKGTMSLTAFASSLGSFSSDFDPKVTYDPVADRYALVFLNGFAPATSSIVVGFSQTNNPKGLWNLYALPGNPFNNNLWTDYPQITFSKDEFFITVNLLLPGGSWQTSFAETIIWELNKKNGFLGQPMNTLLHSNIQYAGTNIRNICPVRGGSAPAGPKQYFLSTRNFSTGCDTLFLINISDTIAASGQTLTVKKLSTNLNYQMPPDARQSPPHLFATNDARVLGAFIENNKIQYVHNTLETTNGFCGVYHGIVDNVSSATPTVSGVIINDPVMDFGYPNISYVGTSASDNTSIINFNHTAPGVFGGLSAIKSDGNGNYSPVLKIKDGTTYVDVLSGNQERWGDYTGTQRKYNDPTKVWVNGYYTYLSGASHLHRTWIAEIGLNFIATGVKENVKSGAFSVFPNPIRDVVTVRFKLTENDNLNFIVYDVTGKEVKILMKEFIKAGTHEFSFSSEPLAAGVYFLKVFSAKQEYATQKIIKN